MKMTFLQMIQSILNTMNSDDVDSYDDTEESLQVASIIVDTYHELMTRDDWNYLKLPIPLESLASSDYPSTLRLPTNVVSIELLRYDLREGISDKTQFTQLTYKSPQEFLDMTLSRDSTATNVDSKTVKGSTTPLYILNDRHPKYWTSFDEEYITLDGYLSTLDSTVMGSKSIVYATSLPIFTQEDTFIPPIPATMFPQFLAECKKACFFYLKESATPIDEKIAFRGQSRNSFNNTRAHERKRSKNYGRPR